MWIQTRVWIVCALLKGAGAGADVGVGCVGVDYVGVDCVGVVVGTGITGH